MAQSLGQELRDPPGPAALADIVAHDSFDDRSIPGTDLQHSGLKTSALRQRTGGTATVVADGRSGSQGGAAAGPPTATTDDVFQRGIGIGRCVRFEEAPPYLRREFILTGYYVGGSHLASIRRTLFAWNNETLNAWTMVAGVVLTIIAWLYARAAFPRHLWPFALMAASALPHAPFSIGLHTLIGVSERTRDTLRTLDVFFILTCGVPRGLALAWFVFPAGRAFTFYTAVIVLDWAWSVGSTCLTRRIKDIPKPQLARDVTSIVLCYTAPMVVAAGSEVRSQSSLSPQAACSADVAVLLFRFVLSPAAPQDGPEQQAAFTMAVEGWPGPQAGCTAAVVALLYTAVWLYSRHLPERWRPGAYDLIGNSHQWMHMLVVCEFGLEWVFLCYRASLAA